MIAEVLMAVYLLGVPVGFVVTARHYASQPPDPFDDDSELEPFVSVLSALLWPLVAVVLVLAVLVVWAHRRVVPRSSPLNAGASVPAEGPNPDSAADRGVS